MAARSIALCADDYGLSMGVSLGILEALEAGRLSAVSAMSNSAFWPAMGRELARRRLDADIGLHFNLTLGAPLSAMPKFAPNGALPPVGDVIRAAMRGRLPMEEITAEIERQLDRFIAVMGRAPDHLDGHQHVHVLPGVRTALFDALERRDLAGRVWLRDAGDSLVRIFLRGSDMRKALAVRAIGRGFKREAKERGFPLNDGFAGFSDFDPEGNYAARFENYLRAPGERHLVMCHPGHVDRDLIALDPVTVTREQELAFLLSPGFEQAMALRGARLGRLGRP
ncbi:ChbG/HpnK family deacetylase [Methylosinus sp. Sm6]|uniref:ChbG/HpnK family deacetylase n=1 Tax=Methylosinus sp. Sm6 TaxID=2866948 RepID=UPI001C99B5E6|nr:ChbG/HpnK family deacetylase [Methylosinus sp. Sm6]MBY6242453.1 ChbG/HpnK family deacetylase [Methylosinus sp. Sm6]